MAHAINFSILKLVGFADCDPLSMDYHRSQATDFDADAMEEGIASKPDVQRYSL